MKYWKYYFSGFIDISYVQDRSAGRKGEVTTSFSTIEFTHTARPVHGILDDIHDVGRPLRLAGKHKACRDLRRVERNTELIDEEMLHKSD